MRILGVTLIALCWGHSVAAAETRTILFLDGARIEVAAKVTNGRAEVSLPAALVPGTVRVRPVGPLAIDRVQIEPVRISNKERLNQYKLNERKEQLEDRLKALETREEVFISAAKSQSGKAPRRSKNNPEPLVAIRQGTDYALSQLEGVYQARRKAEKELGAIDSQLDALKKKQGRGAAIARIHTRGKTGKVEVSYVVNDLKWAPVYDFRVDAEGGLQVIQRALFHPTVVTNAVQVIPAKITDTAVSSVHHVKGPLGLVAQWKFPMENQIHKKTTQDIVTYEFTNASKAPLPAGEAACFYRGEYFGQVRFPGGAVDERIKVTCGI